MFVCVRTEMFWFLSLATPYNFWMKHFFSDSYLLCSICANVKLCVINDDFDCVGCVDCFDWNDCSDCFECTDTVDCLYWLGLGFIFWTDCAEFRAGGVSGALIVVWVFSVVDINWSRENFCKILSWSISVDPDLSSFIVELLVLMAAVIFDESTALGDVFLEFEL